VSAHAKLNLCPTLGRQGRLEEARSLGLEALAAFKLEANPRLESTAHVYLAEALTLAGDLVAAKRHARAAVDVAPPGPSTAFALAACARAELVAGNAREALACAEQARTLLGSVGGMDEGEAMLRLVWAEALAANGRHDEARRAIAEARDRLLERADKIASVEWRRSFLERMSENARTLTLSRVWLGEPSEPRVGKG
jgi:tetratricopeptide (TPR) repeat protein